MAYYKVTEHPKEDSTVREMQSKLNCIRVQYNCSWPYLQIDGKYGKQTALAVKGFQLYRNITPASGEMGDTTIGYINEMYSHVPQIRSAQSSKLKTYNKQNKSSNHPLADVFDVFVNLLNSMNDAIKEEIAYASHFGHSDGKSIANHFRASMGRFDPQLKRLKDAFAENQYAKKQLGDLTDAAKSLPQKPRSQLDSFLVKKNQSNVSHYTMMQKTSAETAERVSKDYINNLKKYDIVSKISNKLKRMGITGEIRLSNQKTIQIKAGGFFTLWSVKDVLWDLLQFNDWGEEAWKEDLLKDCYNFLDQVIVGTCSAVIAEVVVVAAAAAVGATISAGTLIAIIAVVAIIIGLIIAWIINLVLKNYDETSFSKFLWEETATHLLSAVYSIR